MMTPLCPLCRDTRIVRIRRSSPLLRVLSLLGYYPWNCENCGHHFERRDRGRVRGGGERSMPAAVQDQIRPHSD